MGRIISDVTKRELIVQGYDEMNRITRLHMKDKETIMDCTKIGEDVWRIELIYKVESYYKCR